MRSAKVIALHIGGRGNKIFNYGDIVTEKNFPEGNFDRLIEQKFISELVDEIPSKEDVQQMDPEVTDGDIVTEKKEEIKPESKERRRNYNK
jgi:hypothetical protein